MAELPCNGTVTRAQLCAVSSCLSSQTLANGHSLDGLTGLVGVLGLLWLTWFIISGHCFHHRLLVMARPVAVLHRAMIDLLVDGVLALKPINSLALLILTDTVRSRFDAFDLTERVLSICLALSPWYSLFPSKLAACLCSICLSLQMASSLCAHSFHFVHQFDRFSCVRVTGQANVSSSLSGLFFSCRTVRVYSASTSTTSHVISLCVRAHLHGHSG